MDIPETSRKWICELCKKEFTANRYLWAHQNRTKIPCISKEKCKELVQEIRSNETRINYFKEQAEQQLQKYNEEIEKQKKENEYLKSLLCKVDDLKYELTDKLDIVQETVENKNNTFTCNQNLNVINNNENNNNIINIEFSKPEHERLDHITQDIIINILDQKT